MFFSNEEDHAHGLVPILGGKLKDGAIDRLGEIKGFRAVCLWGAWDVITLAADYRRNMSVSQWGSDKCRYPS